MSRLLLETGDALLLETGDGILLQWEVAVSDGFVFGEDFFTSVTYGPVTVADGLILGDSVRDPKTRAPGDTIYTAEITAYDPETAGPTTLYHATGLGFVTEDDDTPASTYFDARIAQPLDVGRTLFAKGMSYGEARTSYGELVLLNPDGELDDLLTLGLDGRTLVIRRGQVGAPYPSEWTTVSSGTMEQPEVVGERVIVRVRDNHFALHRSAQPLLYSGTNQLPDGLEGTASDLMGQHKPLLLGSVLNISPPCVNTAKLIYQVSADGINDVSAVYDRSIALTQGTDYASEADLLNDAMQPASGHYKVWPDGGMFRLGSTPDGQLTCDAEQGAALANRTPGQLFVALLEQAGYSTGDWSAADITALDGEAGYEVGIWIDDGTSYVGAINQILSSVGAWWASDADGVWRTRQLHTPTGTPDLALAEADLLAPIRRVPSRDAGHGLPPWRVTVNYQRNYTIQQTTAPSVARRAFLANKWRSATASDVWTLARHLLAPAITEDSYLVSEGDARAEALRRLEMRASNVDRFELVVPIGDDTLALELGDVIQLTHSRYGLDAGELFRVLGIFPDAARNRIVLDVWGASAQPAALGGFAAADMVMVFLTAGTSAEGRTVRIPLQGTTNVDIDWGDGSTDAAVTTANPEHTYDAFGAYVVKVSGSATQLGNTSPSLRWTRTIQGVLQWGNLGLTSLSAAFREVTCPTLIVPTDLPATVTDLSQMFFRCYGLTEVDVSGWNVSAVTTFNGMFADCHVLTELAVSGWNVGAVTGSGLVSMFSNCRSLEELDLSTWDVSGITNLNQTFADCTSLKTLNVSTWDVSNVTAAGAVFEGCAALSSLNLSLWNVSAVTSFRAMFNGCASLSSLAISGWATTVAQDMVDMFRDMGTIDVDVSGWSIANMSVPDSFDDMFYGSTLPTVRYDALLIGWEGQVTIPANATFHGGSSTYTGGGAAEAARTALAATPNFWTIADGGVAP